MEKACFECGEIKNIDSFYKHPGMKDGYVNKCKLCTIKDRKEYLKVNSDLIKSRHQKRVERHRNKTKYCPKCKKTKPISDFYEHPFMKDGHAKLCGFCYTDDSCEYYGLNKDKIDARGYKRMQLDSVKDRRNARQRANKEGNRARRAIGRAIELGEIERGVCEVCGVSDTHGHHEDYSQQLSVNWLCHQHHMALHKEKRRVR